MTDEAITPEQFVFPCRTYAQHVGNGITEVTGFEYLEFAQHHYWFTKATKVVQLAKIVRNRKEWEAQHDGVYNSLLLPLAKAPYASYRGESTVHQHD